MNRHGGFSLGTLVLLAFAIIGTLATLFIRDTLERRQQAVVIHLGEQEARRGADQIQQHLYSVMRKGWSRREVDDILKRIAATYPDMRIDLIRAESVARQYGDDARSAATRAQDEAVRQGLLGGRPAFAEHDGVQRFIMPLTNNGECTGCHVNAENSVNGLIDIRIQSSTLRAPIEATLKPILNMVTLLIALLFLAMFLLVRYRIIRPIMLLSRHVEASADHLDRATEVTIGRAWPSELRMLGQRFNNLLSEVQESHRRLRELSARDKLTGLYNRHYLDEMLTRIIGQAKRAKQPVALLMLDLDGFKPINDRYGHATGDRVLADVAARVSALTRDGDVCGRLGGDEFVIVAVNSDMDGARLLSERLRADIRGLSWSVRENDPPARIDVSIGIAEYPEHALTVESLLDYADRAMYDIKRSRRGGADSRSVERGG
jgi:diguanylate cyclase (GGDEF)-like protein